jgi:hypothetical protein
MTSMVFGSFNADCGSEINWTASGSSPTRDAPCRTESASPITTGIQILRSSGCSKGSSPVISGPMPATSPSTAPRTMLRGPVRPPSRGSWSQSL